MEKENSPREIIDGINHFLNNLPGVTYGSHVISSITAAGYEPSSPGFEKLRSDFQMLDLTNALENVQLEKSIIKQKKELDSLEKKHASLVAIFGEDGGASEGTLTHNLMKALEDEISALMQKRNELLDEVAKSEIESKSKINEFRTKISDAETSSNAQISSAETEASAKVKIIKQFSDFLAETNSNMRIYAWVLFLLVAGAAFMVALSVPDLLECFRSYDLFIWTLGAKATSWQILNFAFGLLIVKLPWALCLSAVFTGMYRLIKGLLSTYEKINQDKRNISAIYAVSGNIAEALNEYGLSIADHDAEDGDTGERITVLRASNSQIKQKRESLKWNQIMNYFERMQTHKDEPASQEDSSQLKFATDLIEKILEKVPAVK